LSSQPAHQAGAVAVAVRGDHLARDVPFVGDEDARNRRGVGRLDRLLDEGDAVLDQEVERRDVLVGKHAHQLAVVKAAVAAVVAHPVAEHPVGAVLDAELALQGMAAAELHAAAAQHAVSADVVIFLDDDDRGAVVPRRDRGGKSGDAGADDYDVSGKLPFHTGAGSGRKMRRIGRPS
jgi:hypothetical protein